MNIVWLGTIAEFIKLAPVISRAQQEGMELRPIATGQNDLCQSEWHDVLFPEGIETWVTKRHIPQNFLGFLFWTLEALWKSVFLLRKIRKKNALASGEMKVLVHGDTVSTLIGAIAGSLAGAKVVHVEGGLRSFNWLSPFPEEINRVGVSRLASVAFCPGEWACDNLKYLKSIEVVNTHFNTIVDVMDLPRPESLPVLERTLPEKYFLFVCHRQENLMDRDFLEKIIERMLQQSEKLHCVSIIHKPAEESFRKFQLLEKLTNSSTISALPRQSHYDFTQLLRNAEYVVTDGGSNQEECFYLGKACLILRKETERREGLGENAVLSMKDFTKIDDFLADPYRWRRERPALNTSPSQIIVDRLKEMS